MDKQCLWGQLEGDVWKRVKRVREKNREWRHFSCALRADWRARKSGTLILDSVELVGLLLALVKLLVSTNFLVHHNDFQPH